MSTNVEVVIIGAGLSGLTLALALHKQGIHSTIYESRPGPLSIGGAVMLSPNALKITNSLGFYDAIKSQGYNFELLDFKTPTGTLIDTYEFGSVSKYGYEANRIYRHELIDIILDQVRSSNSISINFGHKFSHVVHETTSSVTFAFVDGTQKTASFLIGADGIHSTVRKYLYPTLEPQFTYMLGITAAVPTSQLNLSQPLTRPLTIMNPGSGHGAFVIAPQKVDGSEVLIGKQKRVSGPEPTREEWNVIHADKDASIAFLKQDAEIFGSIAINATIEIPHDKINVWPFYVIPKLDKWTSDHGRVVILGDAAHAIPPSAGQGINQAFEDVYILALLLGECYPIQNALKVKRDDIDIDVSAAMAFWQQYRRERVERVLELNAQIDARRAPASIPTLAAADDGRDSELARKPFDLDWLYDVNFDMVVEQWIERQAKG